MSKFPVLTAVALALLLSTTPALAAKSINGKKCTGMVGSQKNPKTGEVTYVCRTADGSIESGTKVDEVDATAAGKPAPKVPRGEQVNNTM